jgi:hypothetical protein
VKNYTAGGASPPEGEKITLLYGIYKICGIFSPRWGEFKRGSRKKTELYVSVFFYL